MRVLIKHLYCSQLTECDSNGNLYSVDETEGDAGSWLAIKTRKDLGTQCSQSWVEDDGDIHLLYLLGMTLTSYKIIGEKDDRQFVYIIIEKTGDEGKKEGDKITYFLTVSYQLSWSLHSINAVPTYGQLLFTKIVCLNPFSKLGWIKDYDCPFVYSYILWNHLSSRIPRNVRVAKATKMRI